jgi:hypothetical protein
MASGAFRQTVININLAGAHTLASETGIRVGSKIKPSCRENRRCTFLLFPTDRLLLLFFAPGALAAAAAQSPGHYLSRRLDI